MAGIVRYREGSVTVSVSGELASYIRTVLEETAPELAERMESGITRIFDHAYQEWPVKTGRSRDGLRTSLILDRSAGQVAAGIIALVPYTVYIKPKKLMGRTTAWQEWVRGPTHRWKKELIAELPGVIVARAKRAR